MSEPPWKSHKTRKDHFSDPLGTDSLQRKARFVGVLGVAPCHIGKNKVIVVQVRPAGQAGYPISLVASLDTVLVKCRVLIPLRLFFKIGVA